MIFNLWKSFFFEEAKLAHLNWHRRESNMRPQGGAHSQVPTSGQPKWVQFMEILVGTNALNVPNIKPPLACIKMPFLQWSPT